MDTYVSTYKKDYKWPIGSPAPMKNINETSLLENKLDPCCKEIVSSKFVKHPVHQIQLSSIPSAANRDNQPDGFLGQLYESYPYLYNIKKGPSDDAKLNVFRQRYITTYQREFCKKEDIAQKENVAEEKINCSTEKKQDETSLGRLRKPSPKLMTSDKSAKKGKDGSQESTFWKPQISEYMDVYSKTGAMILERKLLSRKPR